MKKAIEVIEDVPVCAWCGKALEKTTVYEHVTTCKEHPVNVEKRYLRENLIKTYGVSNYIELPSQIRLAIERAYWSTIKYVRSKKTGNSYFTCEGEEHGRLPG